jgi:D-methionine transport system ATP-binding protein
LNNGSRVLTLVGLEAKRNDYPAQLSRGQKQRVVSHVPWFLSLKSCSVMKPPQLDPESTANILSLLKQINQTSV